MSRLRTAWAKVRGQVAGQQLDEQFDEELQTHLALMADDYERRGLTRAQAQREARRQLGGVSRIVEERRDARGLAFLDTAWQDLRYALRVLRTRPQFTAAAVLVLTLGIGAVTAIFAVVDVLVFRPLPYPEPDRLVQLQELDPKAGYWSFSQPDLVDAQQRVGTMTVSGWAPRTFSVTGDQGPQQVKGAMVSASFFDLLGRAAMMGRTFAGAEDRPGGPRVAVVTRRFWTQRLQADPNAVGRPAVIDGNAWTVIGVLPDAIELLPGAELFVPLGADPEGSRGAREVEVIGRLKPGVTRGAAEAELVNFTRELGREFPATHAGWSARAVPFRDWLIGPQLTRLAWVLFGAVAALCLLACANVACLLLAQGSSRQQEFAMRRALGASNGRVVRQLLTESLCLAAFGAAGGLVLALTLVGALRDWAALILPQLADVRLDGKTLLFAALATAVTSVLAGLSPARAASRTDLQPLILRSGRTVSSSHAGRRALVVTQVALATLLAIGATLLCASFLRLNTVDVGFDPERAMAVPLIFPESQYDATRRVARLQEVLDRVQALPGVRAAGATSVTPFQGFGTANQFRAEGLSADGEFSSAAWRAVTPGFFSALGLPLKQGRFLDARDAGGAAEVVVITESMARRFWPNQDPVGRRLLWGRRQTPKVIVGVVGDYRDLRPDAEPQPTMFRPHAQLSAPVMTMIVRTAGKPEDLLPEVRAVIRSVLPDVPFEETAVSQMFSAALTRPKVSAAALALFAGVALLLAATGVYGLMSYTVAQRRRELAIRLALGALPQQLMWNIVRQSATLVGIGAAAGGFVSLLASRSLASLLYRTSPTEVTVYAAVLLVLIGIGVLTAFGPARRAMRTSPATALTAE
jgi:predicted permease